MKNYPLTKRWRTSEYTHHATKTRIGIYVVPESGEFYARVPERDDGHLVKAESQNTLHAALKEACAKYLEVEWSPVIRVELARVGDSFCGSSRAWDPTKPETAGDTVSLKFERIDLGRSVTGTLLTREYMEEARLADLAARGFTDMRRTSVDHWKHEPGIQAELPYTDATWQALHDFRDRIRELNHGLRHLISSADFEPLLLQAARTRLLNVSPEPKE